MNVKHLESIINSFNQYLDNNIQLPEYLNHPASKVSLFWKEYFDTRPNFLTLNEYLDFRRNNSTWGSGDTLSDSVTIKRSEFENTLNLIRLFVPETYLESIEEPLYGAPFVFRDGNVVLSANFAMNAGTSWQTLEIINSEEKKDGLNILEIGAGFGGCAYQIMTKKKVNSYSIVDLPENLSLSHSFLGVNFPNKKIRYGSCEKGKELDMGEESLNFILPAGITNISGKFDLILNSFSLQEMDLESTQEYVNWIPKVLSPSGSFLSYNCHDKVGITKASQYINKELYISHLRTFRTYPTGFLNTIPYLKIIKLRNLNSPIQNNEYIDTICEIRQLGVSEELDSITDRVLLNQVTDLDKQLLKAWSDVFYEKNLTLKENAVHELIRSQPSAINFFIAGNFYLAINRPDQTVEYLKKSLLLDISGFAKLRALVISSLMTKDSKIKTDLALTIKQISSGLQNEIEQLLLLDDAFPVRKQTSKVFDIQVTQSPIEKAHSRLKRIKIKNN